MDVKGFTVTRYTERFDEMAHFYRDQLGWTPTWAWDRGPDDRGLYVSPRPAAGTAQVEILARHQQLTDAGVEIARGLETTPWGHRSFGVDDPDGLRIWFFHAVAEGGIAGT